MIFLRIIFIVERNWLENSLLPLHSHTAVRVNERAAELTLETKFLLWSALVEAMRRIVTNLKGAEPLGIFSSEAFKPLRARAYLRPGRNVASLANFPARFAG